MRDPLSGFGLEPVLVDVGASRETPDVWAPIAGHATYVGFDPDRRELRSGADGRFRRALIVNEAVASEPGREDLRFYLTRAPYCSSALEPDAASLANYHFHALFDVERQVAVRASTLDAILARLGLDRVDWLKCDTQGTDLRIFRSLGERLRAGVLALDVEPGLIDAYRGEDLFAETHAQLSASGFWLSRLDVHGAVRVRGATLRAAYPDRADPAAFAAKAIRSSPGWCEARYLRTLEFLAGTQAPRERYALLWAFSLLDEQPGYALDVALECARRFGEDDWSRRMRGEAMAQIARGRGGGPLARIARRIGRALRGA